MADATPQPAKTAQNGGKSNTPPGFCKRLGGNDFPRAPSGFGVEEAVTAEVKDRPTYDEDFYAWTQDQAKHLRAQARLRHNEPLDWLKLAEEVEDLGNEQRRAVAGHLERLIQHLLKLEFANDQTPRRQWLLSIDSARAEIDRRWTATIARDIAPTLEKAHARGRRAAALELEDHGEPETAQELPEGTHYTLDQLLDEDWYPAAPSRD